MDDFESDAPEAAPPLKKRSLFSSKAIARSKESEEAVEFFSRAKEMQILAEEERRRQKRLMRLERKRSSMSADTPEITPPEEKRRRVSAQAKKDLDGYSSDESHSPRVESGFQARRQSSHTSPGSQRSRKGSSSHKPHSSPTSLSARYSKEATASKQVSPRVGRSTGCITLSDSEEESPTKSLPVRAPAKLPTTLDSEEDEDFIVPQPQKSVIVEEEEQFSDEEYPELVAAARERARLKAEETAKSAKAFEGQNHGAGTSQDFDDMFEIGSGSTDPTVEILITSEMDSTKPLRVKRRISQPLSQVRLAWCDAQRANGQPIGPEFKDAVFLTWKHIRLYDSSTCNGLGLKVNELGNLVSSTGDGFEEDGRVHLEAWTPDAFAVFQKEQAAKKKQEQGQDAGTDAERYKEPAVPKIRLIFKSRDLRDFKLMVKPSTTVERMVEAFREGTEVSDDKNITMYFDGDKLEYSDKVEDTELGDMDTIEVHIK